MSLYEVISDSLDNWDNLSADNRDKTLKSIFSLLEQQQYPLYINETEVMLIYYGSADAVKLSSDITGWTDPIMFNKLGDTEIFYLRLKLESDARIEYQLIVDEKVICDPLNKYKSLNGLGALSELPMPCYKRHPYHDEYIYGKQGNYNGLTKHILPAGSLPYEHEVFVYLPQGYVSTKTFPTLYFHDGPDYIRFGLASFIIKRLIKEKRIEPCVAVFITPPNLHKPVVPNRSNEYGMNDDYVSFFCDELVNFIDNNYSTIRSPEKRLVTGDSYAGLISMYIAFQRPDLFAKVYSQSGYYSFQGDKMIRMIKENETKPLKLFLDVGTYEKKVGADFLPSAELDFTAANRRMERVLHAKGYDFQYREYPEGHTWGNWRRHLIDALTYFFPYGGSIK